MRREDSTVQFCTGFSFGLLLGTFLVLLLSAWLHGRADVKTLKAASRTRDMHADPSGDDDRREAGEVHRGLSAGFAPEPKPIIDMNRIVQIESSGNANSVGTSGERGLCQIMPKTWKQVTREMGVDWTFDEAWDPVKNLAVGTHYMTVTIPRYLRSIDMPDTASARAVCYNWGFGNLRRAWHEHGGAWLSNIPDVRQDYYHRYTQAEPAQDYVLAYAWHKGKRS